MKKPRRLYLAAYDICEPGRLQDALYVLKGYASGRQKSVFECFLNRSERRQLLREIRSTIDPLEDRFLLLPLARSGKVATLGVGVAPADPDYYYIG